MKCKFYDDGHGNGSYIPGSHVGPPSCSLGGNERCQGNKNKCNINTKRITSLKEIIISTLKQINKEF